MSPSVAEWVVVIVQGYLALGLLFAIAFAARGVSAIDPLAQDAGVGFRLLIMPGTSIFWPLFAVRWWLGSLAPPVEINAHRLRARRAR